MLGDQRAQLVLERVVLGVGDLRLADVVGVAQLGEAGCQLVDALLDFHQTGSQHAAACRARPGCRARSVPSSAANRSASPRRPEPPVASAPPTPSSVTSTVTLPFSAPDGDRGVRRLRVLGDVGQRLGDDEVGRALDRLRQPLVPSTSSVTGSGAREVSASSAGSSPRSVSTAGWMPRASSRSSSRLVWSSSCAWSSRSASSAVRALARRPQQQGERHEPRLRAVVQVALEPPALGVAGLHDPRPRRPQLLHEVRDGAAQQAADERERSQPGRDEGGPERGFSGARARHRDEQEGQQRGDVDRRALEAQERVGLAPALRGPHDHDQEQRAVEHRAEREQDRRQVLVPLDQQDVGRALRAVEVLRGGEQQAGDEGEREDEVAGDHDRAVEPGVDLAARERHPEVQEERAPERAGREADRVDERVVRRLERRQQPGEAERHEQPPRLVRRLAAPRPQAAADEPPADGGAEDRERGLGLLVVAREHHDRDPDAGQDGHDGDRAQQSGARVGHALSIATDGCSSGTAPSQPAFRTSTSDGAVITVARPAGRGARSV